jgi:predicted transcriptional regulator
LQVKNALAGKKLCRYAIAMTTAKQLQADIEAFCKEHSLSGSKFSALAVGDPAFWFKFTRGRTPTLDTYDKIQAFMRDYRA